jgi:hypothetical protein
MLSARGRQWIAPDCRVGRVRDDGYEQPLHHLAGVYARSKGLEEDLHALQAGIERWRRVSPYFMAGGGGWEVGEGRRWKAGMGRNSEARQGSSGIICSY